MPSLSCRESTERIRISSRASSKGRDPTQPSEPSRCTQTVTREPGLPRKRLTASSSGMFKVLSLLILVIRSKRLRPARAAGVSEVWIFGVNGLNAEYLAAMNRALPLETFGTE